jgi:hypothetical protein
VITSGVRVDPSLLPSNGVWQSKGVGGVIHAFHNGYWGNWQFLVNASSDASLGQFLWTEGGFQEARGRDAGAEWYYKCKLCTFNIEKFYASLLPHVHLLHISMVTDYDLCIHKHYQI